MASENSLLFENITSQQTEEITTSLSPGYIDQELFNLIFFGFLTVISLYITIALIFYLVVIDDYKLSRFFSYSPEQKFSYLSKLVCLLIGILCFLRHFSYFCFLAWLWHSENDEKLEIFLSENGKNLEILNSACQGIATFADVTLITGMCFVFVFLWFRQRVFYAHPNLKLLNNRFIGFISFSLIFVWFLFLLIIIVIYIIFICFKYIPMAGCEVKTQEGSSLFRIMILSFTAVSIFMQISLLFLFVYPLIKRAGTSLLMQRVKKAFILTIICLVTDILFFSLSLVIEYKAIIVSFYGVSLQLNHIVTILCFDYWKLLLFPWNSRSKKKSRETIVKNNSISHTFHTKVPEAIV